MNKKTEKILMMGTVALLLLGAVAGIVIYNNANSVPGNYVAADSVMTGAEGYLYYNDIENNVRRMLIATNETVVIHENVTVMAAFRDDVLVKDDSGLSIMNSNGDLTGERYTVNTDAAQLTEDYVYYKNIENGAVMGINRESGAEETVVGIAVDKFLFYGNKLVFTTDNTMIFFYDLKTNQPMAYFGDKNIACFDVDDDYLVYSDANNDYKVTKMSLLTGKETEVKGVKTKKLEFKNGRLFYLENTGKEKKEYRLKANDSAVH